jgi:hypothetical protein
MLVERRAAAGRSRDKSRSDREEVLKHGNNQSSRIDDGRAVARFQDQPGGYVRIWPTLLTWALQEVDSYLGYTGRVTAFEQHRLDP